MEIQSLTFEKGRDCITIFKDTIEEVKGTYK